MNALALRGLAQRKLRAALTSLAILLGVAMVSGTFVLTDQITRAFDRLQADANAGIDVVVSPEQTFGSQTGQPRTLDASLVDEIRAIPGVEAAQGELIVNGALVVDGELLGAAGGGPAAPTELRATQRDPFDTTTIVAGRAPQGPAEIALLVDTARENDIAIGEQIGVTTRQGIAEATLVGTFDLGDSGVSLGGFSVATATLDQVQEWFDRAGEVTSIEVTGQEGVQPAELAARVEDAIEADGLQVRTGQESAQQAAEDVNDQVAGFLVPALLAFAGAAVLVGAFIIFNTFSITVAQRAREFALLRCLGASRTQILGTVTVEALVIGGLASVAGILAGLGFAALISALFEAFGLGIPRTGPVLAVRTIAISLAVGLGVTLLAALAPAIRATRVEPVAALSEVPPTPGRRSRRRSAVLAAVVTLAGIGLFVAGAFASGPATQRLSTMAGGAVLLFIGVALSARWFVRPLASAIGWPLARAFHTPGRLARGNAMRNPGRTAITAAALMVGLGLVVYVSVFASSLQTSISGNIDRLVRGDLFIYNETFQPFSPEVVEATQQVPGVSTATALYFEQIEVDGRPSNPFYDIVLGAEPQELEQVYDFEWVEGSAAALDRLTGSRALVEEQFARARDVGVGDTYQVETPSGGTEEFEVIGIYRDPAILQGTIVERGALEEISDVRDPQFVLASIAAGADEEQVQAAVEAAVEEYPAATVESRAEYKETIEDQLGQLVTLIYALLAVSLVISMFGIVNNLYLSIHERLREFGMLRAIGASRAQLRRIVRYESVITATIGGLLGSAIGVLAAWLVISSLEDFGLSFTLPVGQLGVFLVLAVVVGVLGAALPARRGARVDVLAALHHD